MGIGCQVAELIIREHSYKKILGRVLGLGRVTIGLTPLEALNLMKKWGISPTTDNIDAIEIDNQTINGRDFSFIRADAFFRLLGVDEFISIDRSDSEGGTIIHDLNLPIPESMECIADLIVDGSTLGNIFDPASATRNCSRMLKPYGRIVSNELAVNMHNPYTVKSPMWFFDYYCYNKFLDMKLYYLIFDKDKMNVFTPLFGHLNRRYGSLNNPVTPANHYALIAYIAEKGERSTWDVPPCQHHYRAEESWDLFDSGLRIIRGSGRPHLMWADSDILFDIPEGYHFIGRHGEDRFKERCKDPLHIFTISSPTSEQVVPATQPPQDLARAEPPQRRSGTVNDLEKYLPLFENFEPFSGFVPKGFLVDFLGTLTDASFRAAWGVDPNQEGGRYITAERPSVAWGEGFFEAVNWLEAAREARKTYTMITLGACYGTQAICAYRALQLLNPMSAKLVAVEADPQNFMWLTKNFRDNGIDPAAHWLLPCAMSDSNKPVLFPVGSAGSGANNCISTNELSARVAFAKQIIEAPDLTDRVYKLLVDGDTGIDFNLVPGLNLPARIQLISGITLTDLLAPFGFVDYLESDIQYSEIVVFPPAMDIIKAKVRRVHIGTHGVELHRMLLDALAARRFEILFNYEPFTHHDTPWGSFPINDGVITARNLDL